MGVITSLVETFYSGCRPRTHPIEEYGNCYDSNRRSVMPVGRTVIAINESGEKIVIEDEDET